MSELESGTDIRSELEALRRTIERERLARRSAEDLLEAKSLEIYQVIRR